MERDAKRLSARPDQSVGLLFSAATRSPFQSLEVALEEATARAAVGWAGDVDEHEF